jgi:hypothetical protein
LDGTSHTSNDVLAKQSERPKSLNLHEFYAVATLRADDYLQWRNMACELVPRVLGFSREETHMRRGFVQIDHKFCLEHHMHTRAINKIDKRKFASEGSLESRA